MINTIKKVYRTRIIIRVIKIYGIRDYNISNLKNQYFGFEFEIFTLIHLLKKCSIYDIDTKKLILFFSSFKLGLNNLIPKISIF